MKEGYPPVNIKFSDRDRYYDCFNHYRNNDNDCSKMTELVSEYAADELKRYIDIAGQANALKNQHPEDFSEKFDKEIER